MGDIITFKERVKNEAISNVSEYKRVFVDYEYLICSKAYSTGYKNRVSCAFATSDNSCTLGFAVSGRPKSLMKSNELLDNAKEVDLIFRKPRNFSEKYADLHFGDKEKIKEYKEMIGTLISENFFVEEDGNNGNEE